VFTHRVRHPAAPNVKWFGLLHRAASLALLLTLATSAGCGRKNMLAPSVSAAESARAAEQFRHRNSAGLAVHLEGRSATGALWVLDKPAAWNRSLIVYLHGYTLPSDPVALPNNGEVRDSLLARGYAVAASSFSSNGFAVREGMRDSDALREIFRQHVGEPRHTYLFGRSLGGLIGLLLTQRSPEHYDGSFLVCGIVGGSTEEIQYIGDIRVLFDTVYPGVIPGDLEHSTPITNPNTQLIGPIVQAVTANPQGLGIIQLLARHPLAGNSSQEVVTSLVNAIGFSMQAGGDLFERSHSTSFFDNASWTYTSAALPAALLTDINTRVHRYTRAPEAAAFLQRYGEPSPRLRIPMLSLHTTRDPQVPVFHEDLLAQVIASPLLIQRRVERYGHDAFTAGELMVHFNDLVNFAQTQQRDRDDDLVARGALAAGREP
jgi:pimeloyl-ACP methyl ester carboxylesterase